jgi:hypothetical protein
MGKQESYAEMRHSGLPRTGIAVRPIGLRTAGGDVGGVVNYPRYDDRPGAF